MADKHNLFVWSIGCKKSETIDEIDGRFTFFEPVNQEEGRVLITMAVTRLLEMCKEQQHLNTLHPDKINLLINFRNHKYIPYHDESLESVTLQRGNLTYVRDSIWKEGDPNEQLYEPPVVLAEETFQEALSHV